MENMDIYNRVRSVPGEAKKAFNNGRFSGTDINPMWRIKTLTEVFGPAGIGWYYDVTSERSETVGDTVMAIVDLKLYVRTPEGAWSMPIYGTGGNVLMAKGRVSDEGYKMALTDALSVACKALGVGADVYYEKDKTKYTASQGDTSGVERTSAARPYGAAKGAEVPAELPPAAGEQMSLTGKPQCSVCGREIEREQVYQYSMAHYGKPMCYGCQQRARIRKAQ